MGKISADERAAAEEIAGVVERIRRAGSIRSASLETRVDFANSGRDQLVESLNALVGPFLNFKSIAAVPPVAHKIYRPTGRARSQRVIRERPSYGG